MTIVRCLIKYSPDTIEVTAGLKDRIEIWRKATDGIGKFRAKLLAKTLGEWINKFDADDPIQIRFNDIIVFEGYIDRGLPLAKGDVYNQFYELVGRDYGQDLFNKQVNKTAHDNGTTWMYKKQYADLIIDDMLTRTNSEITFTPTEDHKYGTAEPITEISYTDEGDEYLIEAFRKIFEQIDYDFYVDDQKVLHIFPIGSVDSGIYLKCVKDAVDNNILDLQKTEFDTYDLRNYVIAKVEKIDDGWTDGNAADFTCNSGNVVSNDFTIVSKGMGSIKCEQGTSYTPILYLSFPKYGYPYLPFDIFEEETIRFGYRMDFPLIAPFFHIYLEDTDGNQIVYYVRVPDKNIWKQLAVPIGTMAHIEPHLNMWNTLHVDVENGWQYCNGSSTFNWKIVKITWDASEFASILWLDDLAIPLPMVSVKQHGGSQNLYKVRRHIINARNIRTQSELDELAQSELNKLKDPLYSLHVTALGTAGMTLDPPAFKWVPGYMVTVNSPADGINEQQYRISEVHCILSEEGMKGHDFVVEAELVPKELTISGKRLSGIQTPEITLLRELSDRIRYFEKMEATHYDYLPPMPADAATKIRVGDFGNLSDTAIAFTRQWEAEDAEADAKWVVVDDAAAHGGKARAANDVGVGEKIKILDGPLGNVGDFYILMRVKTSHLDANKMVELRIANKDAPQIRYFQNAASDVGGYKKFDVNNTITEANFAAEKYGADTAKIAVRIRKYNGGAPTVIVDWTEITISGSTPTEYTINVSVPETAFDRIIVDLRAKAGTTTTETSFITEILNITLSAATWTFKVFADTVIIEDIRICTIYYGSSAKPSRCTNVPMSEILDGIEIKGNDFPSVNKYHHFAMRTEIPQDEQNLEIAVRYWGAAGRTIHCDYVALLPADVPLGYADVTVADTHAITTVIYSSHSTVTVIDSGHTTTTTIASAHSTSTVIATDHSTTTSIQTAHATATVVASAHSTTAVISNTHSTATVVATDHEVTTAIATAHGTITVIASAHGTSVTIQDTHGTVTEIGLAPAQIAGGLANVEFNNVTVPTASWTLLSYLYPDDDMDFFIAQIIFRVTTANFSGLISTRIRLYDATDEICYPSEYGIIIPMWSDIFNYYAHHVSFTIPRNVHGHTLYWQFVQSTGNNMILTGKGNFWGHSPHFHNVTTQPAVHPVSAQPAGHSVQTQPSVHTVSMQPHGHVVSTQPSGQSVTTQPADHVVSTQPSGHPVSVQPSGHTVQTQPSGHTIQTQPSGHVVTTQPSGHSVTTQPSGHTVIDPMHEH